MGNIVVNVNILLAKAKNSSLSHVLSCRGVRCVMEESTLALHPSLFLEGNILNRGGSVKH